MSPERGAFCAAFDSPKGDKRMNVQHQHAQEQTTTPAFLLSDFMALEGYDLPTEWSWMDEMLMAVNVDAKVDVLRVGPQDVGCIVHEMASIFRSQVDGWRKAVANLADLKRRIAAFEFEVLSHAKPENWEAAQVAIARMERASMWLDGLDFHSRGVAMTEVSRRLDYELDKMEIPYAEVMLEANARHSFLTAAHEKFESLAA